MNEQTGFNWGAVFCPGLWHWAHNMRFTAVIIALFVFGGQVVAFMNPFFFGHLTGYGLYFTLHFWWVVPNPVLWRLWVQWCVFLECYLLLIGLFLPFGTRANQQAWQSGGFSGLEEFRQAQARWSQRAWMLPAVLAGATVIGLILTYSVPNH